MEFSDLIFFNEFINFYNILKFKILYKISCLKLNMTKYIMKKLIPCIKFFLLSLFLFEKTIMVL